MCTFNLFIAFLILLNMSLFLYALSCSNDKNKKRYINSEKIYINIDNLD